MSSVLDAFPARPQPGEVDTPPALEAVESVTPDPERTNRWPSWLAGAWGKLRGDFASWPLWFVSPPTPADLWRQRIPDRDRVPGHNPFLWFVWLIYNHLALPVLVVLFAVAFVVFHPARLLLAAIIAAPLALVWMAALT